MFLLNVYYNNSKTTERNRIFRRLYLLYIHYSLLLRYWVMIFSVCRNFKSHFYFKLYMKIRIPYTFISGTTQRGAIVHTSCWNMLYVCPRFHWSFILRGFVWIKVELIYNNSLLLTDCSTYNNKFKIFWTIQAVIHFIMLD